MNDGWRVWGRPALKVLAAVAFTGVAARFSVPVPGTEVPQSLQTLAVLFVGYLLGARLGVTALVVYLIVGAAGVPVFADGASGLDRLFGPTAGYLVGFVVGGGLLGVAADRGVRNPGAVFLLMVSGHLVILLLGWAWLARSIGPGDAWSGGVAPFLGGGVWKSIAAALMVWGWTALVRDGAGDPDSVPGRESA